MPRTARSASPARHHQSHGSIAGSPRSRAGSSPRPATPRGRRRPTARRRPRPARAPARWRRWGSRRPPSDLVIPGAAPGTAMADRPRLARRSRHRRRRSPATAARGPGTARRRLAASGSVASRARICGRARRLAVDLEVVRERPVAALEAPPEGRSAGLDGRGPRRGVVARGTLDGRCDRQLGVGSEGGLDPGSHRAQGTRVLGGQARGRLRIDGREPPRTAPRRPRRRAPATEASGGGPRARATSSRSRASRASR